MPSILWSAALAFLLCSPVFAQPLDLQAVLARAAEHNPTLKSAYAQVKIAEAEVTGARILENPELDARLLWPRDGAPPLQEYHITYDIISLFSRSGRVQSAEQRREGALRQTLSQAVELESQLKTTFYTVQGHAQALEEQKTLLGIAQIQAELAQRQRDAGNIPELVNAQYKAQLLQSRTQLYDRQMQLFEARQELARLMGQAALAEEIAISPALPDLPAPDEKSAPVLLAEAMSERPDLKAQQYELEALQTERGQQNLLIFDGTHLGYAYEREPSLEVLQGVALTMPLPIFNQRQGEKARLDAQIEQQMAQQDSLSQQVTTEVKTLLVRMANARLRVEQLEQLAPLRQEMLELSRQQYNAMLIGTYELLDFRGDRSQAVLTLADAKADYWRARAELEAALGRSILRGTVPFQPRQEKQ